ncbi:amidohydrolase family protein [Myxococcota bacterium]|nr:amidohydrolase family protein [Myxococcota bacterium]
MKRNHDLLIRGGLVVDGTGATPFEGDVWIRDGEIAAVTRGEALESNARETIDARGKLVTPGFVDVHTHYDGQATWDEQLAPSCWHGVTTIVMGNCGVGFAPVVPGREQTLIEQMEGVEDIPGTALAEGIDFRWESFPEYLDALEERQFMLDVGTQVPHAAVRAYVMGERSMDPEPTEGDLERIAAIVRTGIEAGALGVSTSRILAHRTSAGEEVPGTFAGEAELETMARVLGDLGTGVFEVVPRGMDGEVSETSHAEIDWMGRLAKEVGRPVTFSLVQTHTEIDRFRLMLERAQALREEGAPIHPQVANRATGILMGLQTDQHTFSTRASYREIADLPLAERVARMRDPAVKAKILSDPIEPYDHPLSAMVHQGYANLLPLGAEFEMEPRAEDTVQGRAEREGRDPEELVYDLLLEEEGRTFLLFPFTNYFRFSLDDVHEMLTHPVSVWGLGDGGAHCGVACDAGGPTLMLTHWVRDRVRGPKIPLEEAVRMMTSAPAELYGLGDRGRLQPGLRADLCVIDHDRLQIELPEMIYDLPAGGRRIMQRARGYHRVVVAGEVTVCDDEETGARPGRLIRGSR